MYPFYTAMQMGNVLVCGNNKNFTNVLVRKPKITYDDSIYLIHIIPAKNAKLIYYWKLPLWGWEMVGDWKGGGLSVLLVMLILNLGVFHFMELH